MFIFPENSINSILSFFGFQVNKKGSIGIQWPRILVRDKSLETENGLV